MTIKSIFFASWSFSSPLSSFGFTEKGSSNVSRQQAIGVYGNGFKSGSMRLGRDALIFTKTGGCQSVGMMSQTYLENIKAQAVIVPIVPFNQQTNILQETLWRKRSWCVFLCSFHVSDLNRPHSLRWRLRIQRITWRPSWKTPSSPPWRRYTHTSTLFLPKKAPRY